MIQTVTEKLAELAIEGTFPWVARVVRSDGVSMIPVGFGDVIAVSFAVDGHKVAPCLILKSNLFFPS